MLLKTGYVFDPDHLVLNPGPSGSNSFLQNELSVTNYGSGFGAAGRRTAVITLQANSGANRVDLALDPITWTALGNGTNDTFSSAVLIKENVDDTDSVPIIYFDLEDTLTDGSDTTLNFHGISSGGNVRFFV